LKYKTKHRFDPFAGKSPDQIQFLVTSDTCTQYSKVLYAEWNRIFKDLEVEAKKTNPNVDFYSLDESAQQKMLDDKVQAFIDKLDKEKPIAIPFDAGAGGAGGGSPGAPGGGKAGEPNPADGGGAPNPNPAP
jgi:hypothetical protein